MALLAVSFTALHVLVTVFDGYPLISLVYAVIPIHTAYTVLWLGVGAVSFDLLIAVLITSLVRARLGYKVWRAIHWLAYACWATGGGAHSRIGERPEGGACLDHRAHLGMYRRGGRGRHRADRLGRWSHPLAAKAPEVLPASWCARLILTRCRCRTSEPRATILTMPLTLILGPANSAKAGEVLGDYARAARRDALAGRPDRRGRRRLRPVQLAASGISLGRALTFAGLVEEIARRAGYERARPTHLQRERVIRRVIPPPCG